MSRTGAWYLEPGTWNRAGRTCQLPTTFRSRHERELSPLPEAIHVAKPDDSHPLELHFDAGALIRLVFVFERLPLHQTERLVPLEETAIQALTPVLPLSPGRAERRGFDSYRHGTPSLYVALSVKIGEIIGQAVARHTAAAFVEFLDDLVAM